MWALGARMRIWRPWRQPSVVSTKGCGEARLAPVAILQPGEGACFMGDVITHQGRCGERGGRMARGLLPDSHLRGGMLRTMMLTLSTPRVRTVGALCV